MGFQEVNARPIEWAVSPGATAYPFAQAWMRARAAAIADGRAGEIVWLLEHPPLYTAGVSAKEADLLSPGRFPVFHTERGGQFTYHGPGQRVAYVLMDLRNRGRDVKGFVRDLEGWLIAALKDLGIAADARPGRVGVWTTDLTGREAKIAAIGVRVRRWTTFHGVALNVAPDLSHFDGIVPCGIREHGVTSLAAMGAPTGRASVDAALRRAFEAVFGVETVDVPAPADPDAPADADGDFFYDELMTAQPDAAQEYYRRLLADSVRPRG